MIGRVGGGLVEERDGFAAEGHPVAGEAEEGDAGGGEVAVVVRGQAVVVLDEEGDGPSRVPAGAFERDVLQLRRLREGERLRGREVRRRGEVEVVAVEEELERRGRRRRGGRAEQDRVQLDLPREAENPPIPPGNAVVSKGLLPGSLSLSPLLPPLWAATKNERGGDGGKQRAHTPYVRDIHEQLLIRVALQLRLRIHTLVPSLLDDGHARARRAFVQRFDLVELDLPVEICLEGGRDVVRMVVVVVVIAMIVVMTVLVLSVLVVALVGHDGFVLKIKWYNTATLLSRRAADARKLSDQVLVVSQCSVLKLPSMYPYST